MIIKRLLVYQVLPVRPRLSLSAMPLTRSRSAEMAAATAAMVCNCAKPSASSVEVKTTGGGMSAIRATGEEAGRMAVSELRCNGCRRDEEAACLFAPSRDREESMFGADELGRMPACGTPCVLLDFCHDICAEVF